jgi:DNA/RNA-binding domain of Phe-tRNA-synthetase-like protein
VHFTHSAEIWRDFPELVPGVLIAEGIRREVSVSARTARLAAVAASRLATQSEGELPEIQAWRRAFTRMGLKPTQYRSASESLLRRFRKEKSLPQIHPLIDLCNSVSLAFAIPVAVFDAAKVAEHLEVRYADGSERYESFSGDVESPEAGEVIFADAAGRAHARRWTNRQSASSAVSAETNDVVIVAEALHDTARDDVERLLRTVSDELAGIWSITSRSSVLTSSSPRFEF